MTLLTFVEHLILIFLSISYNTTLHEPCRIKGKLYLFVQHYHFHTLRHAHKHIQQHTHTRSHTQSHTHSYTQTHIDMYVKKLSAIEGKTHILPL